MYKPKPGEEVLADLYYPGEDGAILAEKKVPGKVIDADSLGCLIEFDKPIVGGHEGINSEKSGKLGHCWWVINQDIYEKVVH